MFAQVKLFSSRVLPNKTESFNPPFYDGMEWIKSPQTDFMVHSQTECPQICVQRLLECDRGSAKDTSRECFHFPPFFPVARWLRDSDGRFRFAALQTTAAILTLSVMKSKARDAFDGNVTDGGVDIEFFVPERASVPPHIVFWPRCPDEWLRGLCSQGFNRVWGSRQPASQEPFSRPSPPPRDLDK